MLSATLTMYALSTLDWAIDIRLLWNDLHTLTLTGLPVSHPPFGTSSPPLLVLQGITSVICVRAVTHATSLTCSLQLYRSS